MVKKGIVLGHMVSRKGIKVDKVMIEVIEKSPPPTSVKRKRRFLGHAGFYRRFIQDFSKISKISCTLLEHDRAYEFTAECLKAFETLKAALITAPIIVHLIGRSPLN